MRQSTRLSTVALKTSKNKATIDRIPIRLDVSKLQWQDGATGSRCISTSRLGTPVYRSAHFPFDRLFLLRY